MLRNFRMQTSALKKNPIKADLFAIVRTIVKAVINKCQMRPCDTRRASQVRPKVRSISDDKGVTEAVQHPG
jgi:hypothetical protein